MNTTGRPAAAVETASNARCTSAVGYVISSSSVGSLRCAQPEFCRLHNSIAVACMNLARNSGLNVNDCIIFLSLDFVPR